MGITTIKAKISNPGNPKLEKEVKFMIDSGAIYSIVDSKTLEELKVKPISTKTFYLANGQEITRKLGGVLYEYAGEKGHAPVIFGEKGDSNLMGAVTLEALGLVLDPIKRQLLNLPMALGMVK